MAPAGGAQRGSGSHAHLEAPEETLLELAASIPANKVSLSDKEERILELYGRLHEQQLEKALLTQGMFLSPRYPVVLAANGYIYMCVCG